MAAAIGTLAGAARRAPTTTKAKLLLGAVLLGVGVALPYVVSGFLLTTATRGLILGLFAMSIDLLAGYGGLVSLGQAGIMATAAYGVGYMAVRAEAGHPAQIGVALLAGVAVAALFGLMAMRTSKVYFLMVTLAQGMVVFGLASTLSPVTGAENGLIGVYRPPLFTRDWQFYYLCLAVVALSFAALVVVVRSPFGLALRGLRESESRLRMLGYNPTLHKFYGFMLSGLFATVAGILFAYNDEFVSPTVAAFTTSAQAVLMIILGGIGTLFGPLLGAFVIVYVENVVSIRIDRWPTVMGLIFILMVLFARTGIAGGVRRAWYAWLARSGRATAEQEARLRAAAAADAATLGGSPAAPPGGTHPAPTAAEPAPPQEQATGREHAEREAAAEPAEEGAAARAGDAGAGAEDATAQREAGAAPGAEEAGAARPNPERGQ